MNKAFAELYTSRKSIVGVVAMVLAGLVYFFGKGDASAMIVTIGGVAATIINAIGKEDAAKSAAGRSK